MNIPLLALALNALVVAEVAGRCLPGWTLNPDNDKCYGYYERWSTREFANKKCTSMGGRIARVGNETENDYVRSLISASAWLPMTDSATEGEWLWDDGSAVEYTNWNDGEPSNSEGGENCAILFKGGSWNDVDCGKNYHFVCEAEAEVAVNEEIAHVKTCIKVLKADVARLKSAVDDLPERHVETGELECGHSDNWSNASDSTERRRTINHSFRWEYDEVPEVKVGVTYLDFIKDSNTRFVIKVTDVTTKGFKGHCVTWGNSEVHEARFSFISIRS